MISGSRPVRPIRYRAPRRRSRSRPRRDAGGRGRRPPALPRPRRSMKTLPCGTRSGRDADLVVRRSRATCPFVITTPCGTPTLLRQPRVMDQMPQRSVHGDEELRPREVEHQLQLFLAGVPGDMDVRVPPRTGLRRRGDRGCRSTCATARSLPGIVRAEITTTYRPSAIVDLFVLADGHARKRGRRLALRAGGDDHRARRESTVRCPRRDTSRGMRR